MLNCQSAGINPRSVSHRYVNIRELPHLQKRHQEGQRGLRSLILIGPVRMKSISTTACRYVV